MTPFEQYRGAIYSMPDTIECPNCNITIVIKILSFGYFPHTLNSMSLYPDKFLFRCYTPADRRSIAFPPFGQSSLIEFGDMGVSVQPKVVLDGCLISVIYFYIKIQKRRTKQIIVISFIENRVEP